MTSKVEFLPQSLLYDDMRLGIGTRDGKLTLKGLCLPWHWQAFIRVDNVCSYTVLATEI
ncbi:hypothetical protein KIN20_034764 [Parelaphostrongylus tenuis]|uniref:Uncharacterized protein n=1 Tax=Parelaphostrongylus tenuis TaxID=148309 RepID=A0AAD5WKB2_PARTN|nr:hypothetical protein KIN20_034764 [Parelaphostrongylus tenuis]